MLEGPIVSINANLGLEEVTQQVTQQLHQILNPKELAVEVEALFQREEFPTVFNETFAPFLKETFAWEGEIFGRKVSVQRVGHTGFSLRQI